MLQKQRAARRLLAQPGHPPCCAEAADLIAVGKAVARVDDGTANHEAYGLELVRSIKPILRLPFGVAVKQGNTKVLEPLAINMMQLVQGGEDAIILRLEKEVGSWLPS